MDSKITVEKIKKGKYGKFRNITFMDNGDKLSFLLTTEKIPIGIDILSGLGTLSILKDRSLFYEILESRRYADDTEKLREFCPNITSVNELNEDLLKYIYHVIYRKNSDYELNLFILIKDRESPNIKGLSIIKKYDEKAYNEIIRSCQIKGLVRLKIDGESKL